MSRNAEAVRGIHTVGLCWMLVWLALYSVVSHAEEKRVPIGVSVQKNIRVVYQIQEDDWKGGIGQGLH